VATDVRHADHHAARTTRRRRARVEPRQPERDARSRQRVLADATLAGPVAQAERRLREAGFDDVTEEQQVRMRKHESGNAVGGFLQLGTPGSDIHQNSAVTVTP
jgi:hypothetical protein